MRSTSIPIAVIDALTASPCAPICRLPATGRARSVIGHSLGGFHLAGIGRRNRLDQQGVEQAAAGVSGGGEARKVLLSIRQSVERNRNSPVGALIRYAHWGRVHWTFESGADADVGGIR
jgi:hypothetical protein